MFDYDNYFNNPERVAKQEAFIAQYKKDRAAEDKRINDAFNARVAALQEANKELKADNDAADLKEYNRLFAADKARYLAAYKDEKLAHNLACSDAQYRENQKLGYSNE